MITVQEGIDGEALLDTLPTPAIENGRFKGRPTQRSGRYEYTLEDYLTPTGGIGYIKRVILWKTEEAWEFYRHTGPSAQYDNNAEVWQRHDLTQE